MMLFCVSRIRVPVWFADIPNAARAGLRAFDPEFAWRVTRSI
jgi:hypothetical protein